MNIGLTQRIFYHKQRAYDGLEHGWYSFLKGHTLFPISNNLEQDFNKIANNLDLLFITGGNDPVQRRIVETKLTTEMILANKPVVGICHGCFLLTEMLGGKVESCDNHMDTEHEIIYNNKTYLVNSYHNLQIKQTHNKAKILATDSDGYCESWIDGSLAGIVWHPERMTCSFLPEEILNLIKIS